LLHVVGAATAASRFTCRLNSGQQQRNENSNNRNHDEQLYKRKAARTASLVPHL
jgi:hypothetical protein